MADTQATMSADLQNILKELAAKAPEIFNKLVIFFDTLAQRNQGEKINVGNSKAPNSPIDLTGDTGDGTYRMVSTGLDEETRKAILHNIAEGQVREKAGEWLGGFITGVMLAAG